MDRLFSYKRNLAPSISGFTDDFYLKYSFRTVRRNPTLIFVPTMYSIARGNRNYIGENIGRISFKAIDDYRIDQKTLKSTIPHNRKAMDVMMRFIIPNLYGISLFDKYMLSPFNYSNRIFYRYRISISDEGRACVNFTPKLNNTQLVKGFAIIDRYTGKIIHTRFSGEYDMVTFEVNAYMGDDDTPYALLPTRCDSKAVFKFMGNELRVRFYANFECKVPDIDSIDDKKAESIIDSVRPDPLERIEESIYREHIQENIAKDSAQATVVKRKNKMLKKHGTSSTIIS